MCGILGKINFNGTIENREKFQHALDVQKHRGPDDGDVYQIDNIIFGHRRLSIIDIDTHAKQPMLSECKNYSIVFNGEIYNYREIRDELRQKGYTFTTNSDTEVLLKSYMEYGIEAIQKFIGMFAFALYDKSKQEMFIVRDRLGIKPLYYSADENGLIFSSEIKSILMLTSSPKVLNLDAVSSYLSFRYPILDDSFFENIVSLPPAHYIRIHSGRVEIEEYWNVTDKFKEQKIDKGELYYKQHLQLLLESSVQYRMISDVPLGAFLSGGVDSSVIVALMAQNSLTPVKTFTIGFEEEGYNEFQYARMVADQYKTEHKEIVLSSKDYIETMEKLICFKDAPLSVPNEVPLYMMSKVLKEYITVVLSGEGSDEIFGGYGRIFRSPYDLERIQKIDELGLSENEKNELVDNFIAKYGVRNFSNELDHFLNIYSYTSFDEKCMLLDNSIDLETIEKKFHQKFKSFFNEVADESYYNKLMYAFEKVHLVGLLQRVDNATMAASVEARVPFVDHRVVEFIFTIPMKYKLKWNHETDELKSKLLMSDKISEVYDTPKYILKKAYEEMLPNEILYRKKMGFPVPLNDWFGGGFNDYARKILLSQKAIKRNLYNGETIKNYLDNAKLDMDQNKAIRIWMLLNLELFIQYYFDNEEKI